MEVFNDLDFNTKCDILRKHGLYVASVTYFHFTIKLYSLGKYFIEMYYDSEKDEVIRISVASSNDINKHLSNIELNNIKELLE